MGKFGELLGRLLEIFFCAGRLGQDEERFTVARLHFEDLQRLLPRLRKLTKRGGNRG